MNDPITTDIQGKAINYTKRFILLAAVLFIIFITILALSFYGFSRLEAEKTANLRDVFIIVLAIEALLIGLGLFVLILQIGMMINLLQNQIKPILEDTQITVQKVKATTSFLAKYAVKPIISLNSYSAGFKKLLQIVLTKKI